MIGEAIVQRTQRLNVILVKTSLDVFDHQTRLPDLRVSYHADLYNDTVGEENVSERP